jgi:hypothetical protein
MTKKRRRTARSRQDSRTLRELVAELHRSLEELRTLSNTSLRWPPPYPPAPLSGYPSRLPRRKRRSDVIGSAGA